MKGNESNKDKLILKSTVLFIVLLLGVSYVSAGGSYINNLFSTAEFNATTRLHAPEICLAGSCQTSWPTGADGTGGWTNTSTYTYTPLNTNISGILQLPAEIRGTTNLTLFSETEHYIRRSDNDNTALRIVPGEGVSQNSGKSVGLYLTTNTTLWTSEYSAFGIKVDDNSSDSSIDLLAGVSAGRQIIIMDMLYRNTPYAKATRTYPVLYLQYAGSDVNDFLALSHDGTDGQIEVGTGKLQIRNSTIVTGTMNVSGTIHSENKKVVTSDIDFAQNDTWIVGMETALELSTSSGVTSDDRHSAYPFINYKRKQINALGFGVTVANTSVGCMVGIFNNTNVGCPSPLKNCPGSLLGNTSYLNVASAALINQTVPTFTLEENSLYWAASNCNLTGGTMRIPFVRHYARPNVLGMSTAGNGRTYIGLYDTTSNMENFGATFNNTGATVYDSGTENIPAVYMHAIIN